MAVVSPARGRTQGSLAKTSVIKNIGQTITNVAGTAGDACMRVREGASPNEGRVGVLHRGDARLPVRCTPGCRSRSEPEGRTGAGLLWAVESAAVLDQQRVAGLPPLRGVILGDGSEVKVVTGAG